MAFDIHERDVHHEVNLGPLFGRECLGERSMRKDLLVIRTKLRVLAKAQEAGYDMRTLNIRTPLCVLQSKSMEGPALT